MKIYLARITYLLFAFVFLCPGLALAWGPAMHLYLGNTLLSGAAVLLPSMYSLLKKFSQHFLYGSLSADFFVGKGYRANGGKYHNWETGLVIRHGAETDEERAFAAGFLAHLAADTVAHGYFIPHLAGCTPLPTRVTHLYWEWLADCSINCREYNLFIKSACRYRKKGQSVFTKMDDYLCSVLDLDKGLYLSRKSLYLYPIRLMTKSSPLNTLSGRHKALLDDTFPSYALSSLKVMADVLTYHEDSPVLSMSPNCKHSTEIYLPKGRKNSVQFS
ncbi:MAG: zinc dependent phospholipase C family protein [Thermodesulfobacteriota bacterium]